MSIVRRSTWGAMPPRHVTRANWPRGVTLHVHHTVSPPPPDDHIAERRAVRVIQRYHQETNGWSDVGYSYLIAPSGRIYEGRGYEVRGAHSPPVNHEPSVALIGDYHSTYPTDAQHRAVWELADIINAGRLAGHRDSYATTCPGNRAYAKIVNSPRPKSAPRVPPDGNTLRLVIDTKGRKARKWSGWTDAGNALKWIADRPDRPDPDSRVALAWRHSVWRYDPDKPGVVEITKPNGSTRTVKGGAPYIRRVASTLVGRFM